MIGKNCCTTTCCILHESSREKKAATNLEKSILRSTKIDRKQKMSVAFCCIRNATKCNKNIEFFSCYVYVNKVRLYIDTPTSEPAQPLIINNNTPQHHYYYYFYNNKSISSSSSNKNRR